MNHSKFSLADLLTVLGALTFGFFCFLSVNFLTLGDTVISVIWGVIISLILGGLAFGAKLLKRTSSNFKTCIIWEWVLIFVFIVASLLSIFPFSHFFVVSAQQADIQQKITSNIEEAEGLFLAYESYANDRLKMYNILLNSIVTAKDVNPDGYTKSGFVAGRDDQSQVENKMFSLKAELYPSNYAAMKSIDSTWLSNAKDYVINWSPTGIVKVVNTLKPEISSWNQQLTSYSTFRATGETKPPFDKELSFDDVSGIFTKSTFPNLLGLIIGIGLNLIMLLSYFIANRHSRWPGFKVVFGKRSSKLNEL